RIETQLGPRALHHPPRRDMAATLDHRVPRVEEDQVERESHAEAVDALAAGDQEPLPRPLAIEQRQAQQTGSPGGRHGHAKAEDLVPSKAAEAAWIRL